MSPHFLNRPAPPCRANWDGTGKGQARIPAAAKATTPAGARIREGGFGGEGGRREERRLKGKWKVACWAESIKLPPRIPRKGRGRRQNRRDQLAVEAAASTAAYVPIMSLYLSIYF